MQRVAVGRRAGRWERDLGRGGVAEWWASINSQLAPTASEHLEGGDRKVREGKAGMGGEWVGVGGGQQVVSRTAGADGLSIFGEGVGEKR